MMKTKESSFAGFIDGYQSRNIAYIESNFQYKIIEIKETLLWVQNKIADTTDNPRFKDHLLRVCGIGTDKSHNLMEQLFKIGEFLSININVLNHFKDTDQDIYIRVKIVIFNFVELAKLSEEPKLINLAIEIGAKFQY